MRIAFFSIKEFEKEYLMEANAGKHEMILIESALSSQTASLVDDCEVVSLFVNDDGSAEVLNSLKESGVQYLALRSAGFNHIDLNKAHELNIQVANVPEYSPYAVAEHTVALMLALNRKLVRADHRIKDLNFSLNGLTGFDMHGKTVGIIGLGKIGGIVAKILHGFGCKIIGFDEHINNELASKYNVVYGDLETLFKKSDIITLHVPLNKETQYIINDQTIKAMKTGVMLINTSRGGLVRTKSVINALKTGKIQYLGLDVYEEEQGLFFEDHSQDILQDDIIARLMTFKNVLITSHQAFLTDTALQNIAETTLYNINCWEQGIKSENLLSNRPFRLRTN
jgi:D-lactate dehydrogenase